MKIYDAITKEEIINPDMDAGYTYQGKRFIGTKKVLLNGTIDSDHPDGLFHEVNVYEDCLYYVKNTEVIRPYPTIKERLAAAEAAILELAYLQGGETS